MYINLYLYLFNFSYLFFLSFPLNIFVSFIFIALFLNWHLALVLFSSLCFSQFYSGGYNFWFPLFTRSIYCTLFLLDCFDFAYRCTCICVYSVTIFIFVTNLCLYVGPLQFCGVSPPPFFSSSISCFLFFIILIFNFLTCCIFLYLFLCLPFLLFFFPCSYL